MPIIILLIGILVLLILIMKFEIPAFISLIIVAIGIGVAQGMDLELVMKTVQKGIGSTLGYLALVLGFGAMLGEIIAQSGAARQIADKLIGAFSPKNMQWALVLTGFIIGIPLFYSVGFVMLIPLIFSLGRTTKQPLMYLAIPMCAALSVTHGFLPPHPAPTAISVIYGADLSIVFLYGLILAIPTVIIAGPLYSKTLKNIKAKMPEGLFKNIDNETGPKPGFGISLFTALTPVILMSFSAIAKLSFIEGTIFYSVVSFIEDYINSFLPEQLISINIESFISFIGDPVIALLLALLISIFTLGLNQGRKMKELATMISDSTKGIAMILLIIGAGGALKQVLVDSGLSQYIISSLDGVNIHPLVLAWLVAAALRISLGSATVAALTAAGIVTPLLGSTDVSPELLVIATGAGSLTCSQVNDTGFWMFKEYFGLSIIDTFKSWTVMETIVSIVGLIGVLLFDQFI